MTTSSLAGVGDRMPGPGGDEQPLAGGEGHLLPIEA